MPETNEQKKEKVAALIHERAGAEVHGEKSRIAEIDAQLAWVRGEAKTPAKRAQTREG